MNAQAAVRVRRVPRNTLPLGLPTAPVWISKHHQAVLHYNTMPRRLVPSIVSVVAPSVCICAHNPGGRESCDGSDRDTGLRMRMIVRRPPPLFARSGARRCNLLRDANTRLQFGCGQRLVCVRIELFSEQSASAAVVVACTPGWSAVEPRHTTTGTGTTTLQQRCRHRIFTPWPPAATYSSTVHRPVWLAS